ncbi:hypothetical protein D3C87_574250 [compost metagenome]
MANIELHKEVGVKGLEFKIIGDLEAMQEWVSGVLQEDRYTDDNGKTATDDEVFMDSVGLAGCLSPDDDWKAIMDKVPRKKNGTFAIGRTSTLYRASSFQQLWEDSYGYGGPEIRIKTIDDTTAELQYGWYVEKW